MSAGLWVVVALGAVSILVPIVLLRGWARVLGLLAVSLAWQAVSLVAGALAQ